MTPAVEQSLILNAAAGDRQAAQTLINRHQGAVFAYVLRLSGRRDVAEDVTQEAFVRALTHLDRFDTRYRFSTWLFTIARRLYWNLRERLKPVYDTDTLGFRPGGGRSDAPLVAVESRDVIRDALQRALMRLHETQREIIILFHQHDWPIWLIAQHLELPEGTVKSHLFRGRQRLRELLGASEQALLALSGVR